MMIYRSALFLALAAIGSFGSIEAETVTWDGGQDPAGMQWGVKENWNPEKLPNAGDRVVLPVGAKPTLNIESSIKELVVGELGAGRVATIVGADQTLNNVHDIARRDACRFVQIEDAKKTGSSGPGIHGLVFPEAILKPE